MKRFAIVLAAGQGTRMKSELFKVMHPVMGKPMVEHVVEAARAAGTDEVITVTGVGAEVVEEHLGDRSRYVFQAEQLGTAHAAMQAEPLIGGEEGTTIVLAGDTPLLTGATLERVLTHHERSGAAATVLTAIAEDPTDYGRVIRDMDGLVEKIVEHKDATPIEREVCEINTGTYCFDNKLLFEKLSEVDNDNAQGEYYLPDVIHILQEEGLPVGALALGDMDEAQGVNDRVALAEASQKMKERINREHMLNGVTFIDPDHVYIEPDVTIGNDTVIEPNVYLKGKTTIGRGVTITSGSTIINSVIEDGAVITQSMLNEARVSAEATVGPFAHLRPEAEIGRGAHVGNFVELKNVQFGAGSKAGHHVYLGDATVGRDVNVGCGVITANYNGREKFQTTIGDGAFIGSNATLIAPLMIGDLAFIAGGSTIDEDVPARALGIGRRREQYTKEDYVK